MIRGDNKVDILIRDIKPMYVGEIDKKASELSKKLGRKVSRNEYIKMLIQHDCELKLVKLKKDNFDRAVANLTVTLERQEKKLQEFIDSNARLFHLMASGVDIKAEESYEEY